MDRFAQILPQVSLVLKRKKSWVESAVCFLCHGCIDMEISKSNAEPPRVVQGVGSFFRIAIPAWDWGRGMVGFAQAPASLSRAEMQRIFGQDLAAGSALSVNPLRRAKR